MENTLEIIEVSNELDVIETVIAITEIAQQGPPGGGGGGGSETTTTLGALIAGATAKTTPVDADMLPLMDSAASNVVKKLSWANVKATLLTYFNGVYQPLAAVLTATTAAFTTAQETKLAGIATGATANSSDATLLARANHTGTQTQSTIVNLVTDLAAKADLVGGLVPSAQLPSFVDDVIEAANFAALPGTGEAGKIYVTLNDNKTYRWSGSAYVEIVASPGSTDSVTEGSTNLYHTSARVRAVLLTGLSLATNQAIAATDTLLQALGYLQKQITDLIPTHFPTQTAGGVLFANGSAILVQDNTTFFYDNTNKTLRLLESGYNQAAAGWNSSSPSALQIGNNNTPHTFGSNPGFFGQKIDIYGAASSGNFKQLSGIRVRAQFAATGTSNGHTTTAIEAFVSNPDDTTANANALLQCLAGIVHVPQSIGRAAAGYFVVNAGGAANPTVTTQYGVFSQIGNAGAFTTTHAEVFRAWAALGAGVVTNLYGLKLAGWSGSGVVNSYGIYIDTSIDLGTTLKYAFYSLSTSPSLFSGPVSGVINPYDATGWNGSAKFATEDAVRDEIEAVKATIGGGGYSDEAAQDAAAALFTPDDGDIDYTYNDTTPSITSTIKAAAVSLAKMASVATGTIFYRKTAGTGDPEVQTLATLKTDLGLTGTNSGDQDLSPYFNKSADDTDDITVGSTNKFATAAEKTKLGHITVTQAVDLDDIETRVNNLDAAVVLKGTWDASAGTFPGGGTAQAGASYIVSVGGTVDSVVFAVGDRVIAITDNASTITFASNWFKADYTDQVLSVNGSTGAVTISTISGNAGTATALQNARTIGGVSFDGTANITVSTATGGFTVSGGNLALGTNSITMSGSIGVTGTRVTKGWFTDGEFTNMPTVGGTSLNSTFQPLDSDLTTIAGLTATTDNFIVSVASAWASRTPAQVKTTLSLNNVDNTSNATERAATATLTNKRIQPRTGTTTSSTTPTINTDNVDFYSITAQTADITSFTTNLSGTPVENQKLWIAITGTAARGITWGSSFEASTVALPTTTVSTNRLDVGFVWNTVTSKWRCIAAA